MPWIKRVDVVNSVYGLNTSCSIQRFTLFLILSYSRKDCIGPEQDFPEFLLQDKGQSGWTKGSESRPIPSRKRDRLLDLRLLPGHWRQWIRTRLFRLVYGCSSEWERSGVQYEMGWNLIVNGASLYKLRIRGSKKLKIVLELYNLEIHRKKAKTDYHRLKTIVKKRIEQHLRSRNCETRNGKIESNSCSQRTRRMLTMEGQRVVFERRQNSVSDTMVISVQNQRRRAPRPEPSMPQDVTKSSDNHKSWRSKSIWEIFSSAVQASSQKVLVRIHLVKSGILQGSCFTRQKSNANSGKSALVHTVGLRNSPAKGLKRMTTKVQWDYIEEDTAIRLCISRHGVAEIFIDFTEELTTMPKPIRWVRLTKAVLRQANSRDQKPSLKKKLPRWTSSAQPERSKIRGSVLGRQERYVREAA